MNTTTLPDYLVLGHITADLLPNGSIQPGGTALYAALTAQKLGLQTAILTAHGPELDLGWLPSALRVIQEPAPRSTTFRNVYQGNQRTQQVLAHAPALHLASLPDTWRRVPLVHLGPVVHEVPLDPTFFQSQYVGATPQGWLREWDAQGRVTTQPDRLLRLPWTGINLVIVSEEDIGGRENLARALAALVPHVVLTRAERGATLWQSGECVDIPAYPATVVDPTGAGDVFAAGCMVALHFGHSVEQAVRWGCAAAACAIEGVGISTLPDQAALLARLALGGDA